MTEKIVIINDPRIVKEERDQMDVPHWLAYCEMCKHVEPHTHIHDSPWGLPGAHMAGSERYVCRACGWFIKKKDCPHPGKRGTPHGHLVWILD